MESEYQKNEEKEKDYYQNKNQNEIEEDQFVSKIPQSNISIVSSTPSFDLEIDKIVLNENSFSVLLNKIGYPQLTHLFTNFNIIKNFLPTLETLKEHGVTNTTTALRILKEIHRRAQFQASQSHLYQNFFPYHYRELKNYNNFNEHQTKFNLSEGFVWLQKYSVQNSSLQDDQQIESQDLQNFLDMDNNNNNPLSPSFMFNNEPASNFFQTNENTYSTTKIQKKILVSCNNPLELIAKRVVRPLPTIIVHRNRLNPNSINKFRISLLDNQKNPIENGLVGITCIDLAPSSLQLSNASFISLIFEDIKITVHSTGYYKGTRSFFHLGVDLNDRSYQFISNPFFVSTHGEYFKREIYITINEVSLIDVPVNMSININNINMSYQPTIKKLRISGIFGCSPNYKWFIKYSSTSSDNSKIIINERELDIHELTSSQIITSISDVLDQTNKTAPFAIQVQLQIRDKNNGIIFSTQPKECVCDPANSMNIPMNSQGNIDNYGTISTAELDTSSAMEVDGSDNNNTKLTTLANAKNHSGTINININELENSFSTNLVYNRALSNPNFNYDSTNDGLFTSNGFGYGLLTWKAGQGDLEGVSAILNYISSRSTSMDTDSQKNDGEIYRFDVNERDIDGRTPLFWAVWGGHFLVIQLLIEKGNADINIRDNLSFSCLQIACYLGTYEIMDYLLKKGADPNAKTIFNDTALHYASIKGHVAIIAALVMGGATIEVENEERETPIHWAQKSNLSSIYEYLWAVSPLGSKIAPYLTWYKLSMQSQAQAQSPSASPTMMNYSNQTQSPGMLGVPTLQSSSSISSREKPLILPSELNSEFISQSDIPLQFANLELEPLPKFFEVPPDQRLDLFLRKLRQCCAMWPTTSSSRVAKDEFTILNSANDFLLEHQRSKMIKRQCLLELTEFIGHVNSIPEILYIEFTRMVAVNLFRSLPARHNLPGVVYHPDEDEPMLAADWMHVEIVYNLLQSFLSSSSFDSKIAIRYMNQKFVSRLLELFDTEDTREREQLKVCLHRIYGAFLPHRTYIRLEIKHIFCFYVYETGQHNGIGELLEIVGSFAAGLAIPLKQEHKNYLVEALLPLYKGRLYSLYSAPLSYCILTFLEKDITLATTIFDTLLKFWPVTNSQKTVSFISEVEELLSLYCNHTLQLQFFFVKALKKLSVCIRSSHYQIAERSLYVFNNEVILQFIAMHLRRLLPEFFSALYANQKHWHHSIRETSMKVLELFRQLDQGLFTECLEKYEMLSQLREQTQYQELSKTNSFDSSDNNNLFK